MARQAATAEYSFSADLVRVIAILGVVSIHTLIAVYDRLDFLGGTTWWLSNAWNALARPAIPLFILLSGFLLLSKQETNSALWQRIRIRLIIPFICWFLIFHFWNDGNVLWDNLSPDLLLSSFLHGEVGILYFLLIMIGLYLLLPAIRRFFLPLSQAKQLFVGGTVLVLSMLLSAGQYWQQSFALNNVFLMWLPYLGFFLLGHALPRISFSFLGRVGLCLLYCLSVVSTFFLGYFSLLQIAAGDPTLFPGGALSAYFDFHLAPNIVIMAVSLFTLLFQFTFTQFHRLPFFKRVVQQISQASFGIYLTHLVVITFLDTYFRFNVDYSGLPLVVYLPLKFIVVLLGSYLLTLLLQKTPLLCRTIGITQTKNQ